MTNNVEKFTGNKYYSQEQYLLNKMTDIIEEYDGAISNATLLGVMEILKYNYLGRDEE